MRLVNDQELVQEGAAAHEIQGLDLDARADQVLRRGTPPLTRRIIGLLQDIEVILQRAHPRRHLFFLATGQEADVLAYRHGDAGHDDLAVHLLFQTLRQRCRQGQQGLAGTGLTEQGNEIDVRVHQRIEGVVLLAIARHDAPDTVLLMAKVRHRHQLGRVAGDARDHGIERIGAFLPDKLVDQQRGAHRTRDTVMHAPALLPRLHTLAVFVPEIGRQFTHTAIQQIGIFQHPVVGVILCRHPQGARLDAHVDVFRHQDDRPARMLVLQPRDHAKDLIIDLAERQDRGHIALHRMRLQIHPPGRRLVANHRQGRTLGQIGLATLHNLIQEAGHLPRIARHLAHPLLVVIQLLQHRHRQIQVVLLEAVQRGRIVHQDIGVEHKQLGRRF